MMRTLKQESFEVFYTTHRVEALICPWGNLVREDAVGIEELLDGIQGPIVYLDVWAFEHKLLEWLVQTQCEDTDQSELYGNLLEYLGYV
jgi:hypothetical protein